MCGSTFTKHRLEKSAAVGRETKTCSSILRKPSLNAPLGTAICMPRTSPQKACHGEPLQQETPRKPGGGQQHSWLEKWADADGSTFWGLVLSAATSRSPQGLVRTTIFQPSRDCQAALHGISDFRKGAVVQQSRSENSPCAARSYRPKQAGLQREQATTQGSGQMAQLKRGLQSLRPWNTAP